MMSSIMKDIALQEEEEVKLDEKELQLQLKSQCTLICAIFSLLTKLKAEGDGAGEQMEVMELERQIIYRSDFLLRLSEYLELQYSGFRGGADFSLSMQDKVKNDE